MITIMCTAVTACSSQTSEGSSSEETSITQEVEAQENEASGQDQEAEAKDVANGEMPEGEAPDGQPGEKPDGEAPGNPPDGEGGGFGGGGTVTVDGGTYTTNGLGSPAIYSTADITVSDATLVSNLSEGVCIEGINSITLNDCDLTANNTDTNGNATFYDSIMIYQSMSGDADSGTSTFTMNGGSLTSMNGHVFHVTNTTAVINLEDVEIVNEDSDNILLSVCADGWTGDNNTATVNASNQTLEGTILVGDDSELTLNLTNGSSFTGTISGEITNASGETVSTEVGTVSVSIDTDSTWTLTADTYISSFDGDISSVNTNGYTLYVDGVAMN